MGCGASQPRYPPGYATEGRKGSIVSPEIEPCNAPRGRKSVQEQPLFRGVKPSMVGTYSSHGLKPGANGVAFAKINQDRGLITYPFNDDMSMALFGVFDGHGANGEGVSEYVMWKVQELLLADKEVLRTKMEACLIHAFEESDRQLADSPVAARVSGTAAVVCVLHGRTLVRAARPATRRQRAGPAALRGPARAADRAYDARAHPPALVRACARVAVGGERGRFARGACEPRAGRQDDCHTSHRGPEA